MLNYLYYLCNIVQECTKKIFGYYNHKSPFGKHSFHLGILNLNKMIKIQLNTLKRRKNYMMYFALIDDEDYDRVSKHYWYISFNRKTGAYARTNIDNKTVRLHRFVMNAQIGEYIDHADRNGLNCQKNNLRICTVSQNNVNKPPMGNRKYKGITKTKNGKKYTAAISVNNIKIHMGYYDTDIEAARAYDAAAIKYYGEFAWINFPNES